MMTALYILVHGRYMVILLVKISCFDRFVLKSECMHTNKNIIILENPQESVIEGHTDESADSDASVNNNLQMKCKTPDLVPTSFQDKRFVDKRRSI